MFRTRSIVVTFAVLAPLFGATGCSSTSSAAPPTESGPVSFSTQIQPILQQSCGVAGGTCHGASDGSSQLGLYLAEPAGAMDGYGDPATILGAIVNAKSMEDPTMNIITPGDPENSYLYHKVLGDQDTLVADCTANASGVQGKPCGVSMPQTGGSIGTTDEGLLKDWITQGAKNN